jgi:hypothetical protein
MFTPSSVQCFTPRTGLPTGNTPLENRIHFVFKVLSCLAVLSCFHGRGTRPEQAAFRVGEPDGREPLVARSANYCHSACNLIVPTLAGYWLRTKSYCSRLAHPSPSESFACQFRTGWNSSLTSYPPHRQSALALGGSTTEV